MSAVTFVDLDDTIYDRTRLRPEVVLSGKGGHPLSGLSPSQVRQAIRSVQRAGSVLRHAGLPDVRHDVDDPILFALATALFTRDRAIMSQYSIIPEWQRETRRCLGAAVALADDRTPRSAMRGEIALAALLDCRSEFKMLVHSGQALRADARVVEMAVTAQPEGWSVIDRFAEAWEELGRYSSRYVVTHGLDGVQKAKLKRLGFPDVGTQLISTERAGNPLDAGTFREELREQLARWALSQRSLLADLQHRTPDEWGRMLDADLESGAPGELRLSYPLGWLLARFEAKTPEFYGRILHAIGSSNDTVLGALDQLTVVADSAAWRKKPMSLVVIGDRYLSDVVPVQMLLGPDVGATILLDRGIHASARETFLDGHHPTHVFGSWEGVESLTGDHSFWASLRPFSAVPPLDPSNGVPPGSVTWARRSDFQVTRRLAVALTELKDLAPSA